MNARIGALVVGASHQARAQTRIPQRRAAELLFRPALPVQASADLQRRTRCTRCTRYALSPARIQFVYVYSLRRFRCRMLPILPPSARGLANPVPVGRLKTRSRMPVFFDKSLKQG